MGVSGISTMPGAEDKDSILCSRFKCKLQRNDYILYPHKGCNYET